MLFAHKLGNELSDEEMQEIVELLIAKDIFDRKMYEEHQVLTSVHIQKVWLEATKRRKRDLTPLHYFLMGTKVPSFGIPGYAYNKKTHNLEGLMLELQQLHIVDRNEINAILRLSDYGRLGGYVFKIISSTRWSTVLAKGKYVIAALRKEKTGNG